VNFILYFLAFYIAFFDICNAFFLRFFGALNSQPWINTLPLWQTSCTAWRENNAFEVRILQTTTPWSYCFYGYWVTQRKRLSYLLVITYACISKHILLYDIIWGTYLYIYIIMERTDTDIIITIYRYVVYCNRRNFFCKYIRILCKSKVNKSSALSDRY